MAFKPIDPKRDEFRRYLERSGVIEALTKVFVRIVKERPENPLDYLRRNLGDALHQADSMAYLQSELEEARQEIQRLRTIIENVNPDALRDQPQEHVEKNCVEDTSENQEHACDMTPKLKGESEHEECTEKESEPIQKDKTQQDDLETNIEKPKDTAGGNLVESDQILAQSVDNN
ncbi:c-Myc-binding protein homolog [Eurosta solidaginis]|uniref:c-Myc-binding protein homolog n=1 Tax=Eurosta solidaginis TaxID=178769 RepID=UPI0035314F5E